MNFEHLTHFSQTLANPHVGALLVGGLWSYWFGATYSRFWVMRRLHLAGLVVLILLTFYLIGVLLLRGGGYLTDTLTQMPVGG
ncbi:hypothetical protein XMM379_002156 [Aliiroseovarius sp. xm-m-379]|uniref:hypothetical protein n=1 Tax=unclassified Aliiroseovarius TaxID=2623558 RepID=UPI001568840D|nr:MULTISPECIES: hypothetical protein [unclassified Aliiroseovarius]NRP25458.1 hypothetical protein [Aliiroseovarius sp. xm-m-379]NRP48435.1 hypothetical protein [Aliiroseovarius sp. xm-m-354]NRP13897.1 hypothetical protein [Aliiroseovarius sp. xm-d-517]NRP29451.1 hypothetical protein [Aliiroseovarius sp. xm-m-314]NRP34257.1 hypothetical protein [Aliiroseovarius sp. xm-a-104]